MIVSCDLDVILGGLGPVRFRMASAGVCLAAREALALGAGEADGDGAFGTDAAAADRNEAEPAAAGAAAEAVSKGLTEG